MTIKTPSNALITGAAHRIGAAIARSLACECYVHFIQNIHDSYCMECGGEVDLMSAADFEKMHAAMERQKGSRPSFGDWGSAENPILESYELKAADEFRDP